jgi:hypothetical protein
MSCGVVISQNKQTGGDEAMKRITRPLFLTVGLAALLIGAGNAMAQGGGGGGGGGGGRGNFDPAQFAQQRMDRVKESLEVTNDDEWKVLQPLVQKVFDAEAAVPRGMRGGRRGGAGGGGGGGGRFGGTPSPEVQALQSAIEAKASADDLKAKLAKLRDTRKEKEAALAKVQEDLRKVLTVRQEASAVLMGLLQ